MDVTRKTPVAPKDSAESQERETRVAVNKLIAQKNPKKRILPVYCIQDDSTLLPDGSVVVDMNTESISVHSAGCDQTNPPPADTPLMEVSTTGVLANMPPLQKWLNWSKKTHHSPEPPCLVFRGVEDKHVVVLLTFYLELMGEGDLEGPRSITGLFRSSKLNLQDDNCYTLYRLGNTLGASIFTEAIQTSYNTRPESDIINTILASNDMYTSKVHYMVVPRIDDTFIPPINPAILVNSKTAMITKTKKPKVSSPWRNKAQRKSIHTMTAAVYMNLSKLFTIDPSPNLVVFANIDPSAVLGLVEFYENILNPDKCTYDTSDQPTKDIISCKVELKKKSMIQVLQNWRQLGNMCGATTFEIALRQL